MGPTNRNHPPPPPDFNLSKILDTDTGSGRSTIANMNPRWLVRPAPRTACVRCSWVGQPLVRRASQLHGLTKVALPWSTQAPEILNGEAATRSSDVFSWVRPAWGKCGRGIARCRLLWGRHPSLPCRCSPLPPLPLPSDSPPAGRGDVGAA